MDLLDYPQAHVLLEDAVLAPEDIRDCADHLQTFVQRYLPRFHRTEQRQHALTVLQGKLTSLQRKTTEPIAHQGGLKRRPLQLFVGAGGWADQDVLGELRQHVCEELGHRDGVFVLDGSGFPKKGTESCGVSRQWCGRLGKIDNCQVGVFVAYAAPRGRALLDSRLYVPADWAQDRQRRLKTCVPKEVTFQEKWRLSLDLLDRVRVDLPGDWVVADDEYGRCSALRAELRQRHLRYVLDVPCNTLVREPAARRPPRPPGGKPRRPVFERVDQWVARQPAGRWRTVRVRDGEKGPLRVRVLLATVQTKDEDGCVGPQERLVVLRSVEAKPRTTYAVSNARHEGRAVYARVHGQRHGIEELLEEGKEEVGLDEYEVRSWVGWHHHMTLTLLALWFLQVEKLRLGGKNAGRHGGASTGDLHGTTAAAPAERGSARGCHQPHAAA